MIVRGAHKAKVSGLSEQALAVGYKIIDKNDDTTAPNSLLLISNKNLSQRKS